LKLRETIVGLIVGALAIAIFLGAIYAMGPGTPSASEVAPSTAQPAPAPELDEDPDASS
jgi:hypothetical protein